MKKRIFTYLGVIIFSLVGAQAQIHASSQANDQFIRDYFLSFNNLEADFTQTVISRNSEEVSKGHVWLQRREYSIVSPKFYFDYKSPYAQQLISNSKQYWHYDKDLKQVVIKSLEEIKNNPILTILLSNTRLDEHFTIETIKAKEHYRFHPLANNQADNNQVAEGGEVEIIDIYFKNNKISAFSAMDITGQVLRFDFTKVKENQVFEQSRFEFIPPQEVDVIDETLF